MDITAGNDSAWGGVCTNDALLQTASLWESPTVRIEHDHSEMKLNAGCLRTKS